MELPVIAQQIVDLQNRINALSDEDRLGELTPEDVGLISFVLGTFTAPFVLEARAEVNRG